MSSQQKVTPRTSQVRHSSIPPVSVNSAVAPLQEHFVDANVALAETAPLSDCTTTGTGLTNRPDPATLLSSNATKRTRKSMSRRRGQNGYIEKSGRWFVVRFWQDVAGQEKRALVRVRICPVSGAGRLNASERKRRAREIVQESGADTVEHFERIVLSNTGITFGEQADKWFALMSNPRRIGKNGLPTSKGTLDTWDGIVERCKTEFGNLPLRSLVQDQQPVADFITKLVTEPLPKTGKPADAKTIKNHFGVIKAVVASAKDKGTRKQLFPVAWDNDVLLMPRVNPKKQRRPAFSADQVSEIVRRAEGQYKLFFTLLGASGLRISEGIGLRVEHVLDDGYRLYIKEKNYAGRQEDRLKTANAERTIELHSSVAQLLREHIGTRKTGWVFENKKHKPLCASNLLKRVLHPILVGSEKKPGVTGKKAGQHAFRRYRDGHLRRSNCPSGLLKYWLGHSLHQDMSDLYDGSVMDEAYRLEMSETLGTGFNVPSCTDCTEKEKEATGAVASK